MSRFLNSPQSIIVQVDQPARINHFVLEEKPNLKFASQEELVYYITHNLPNKKHSNGRIYMKINEDGQLFANSVSPYSAIYLDNIEQKIQPLVLAFHNKRYLTYSSCEGHGLSFRRYVGLAFADVESRQYVADEVTNLNIPGVYVKYLESVTNQKIERNHKGDPIFMQKYQQQENLEYEETKNFNIQFHRNYDKFYFLEIVILEEAVLSIKKPFKLLRGLWLLFMKKYFWDTLTQKITTHINSEHFKKYKY